MKIFVAGHKGLVGSAICRVAPKLNVDLILRDRSQVDLVNQREVRRFFESERLDAVIMCAAKVGGILANKTEMFDFAYENSQMALNVIKAAVDAKIPRLIFLGSSCIYPSGFDKPISESALLSGRLEPTNEGYALAKILGLKLCQYARDQYGMDYRAIMPCNVYGPGDTYDLKRSHVIPALIAKFHAAKLRNEARVTLMGDGSPRREFIYADDLAEIIWRIMQMSAKDYAALLVSKDCSHINVGVGQDVTISHLSGLIAKAVGFEGQIEFDKISPNGVSRKLLDITLLTEAGWLPKTTLEAGVEAAYADFKRTALFNL